MTDFALDSRAQTFDLGGPGRGSELQERAQRQAESARASRPGGCRGGRVGGNARDRPASLSALGSPASQWSPSDFRSCPLGSLAEAWRPSRESNELHWTSGRELDNQLRMLLDVLELVCVEVPAVAAGVDEHPSVIRKRRRPAPAPSRRRRTECGRGVCGDFAEREALPVPGPLKAVGGDTCRPLSSTSPAWARQPASGASGTVSPWSERALTVSVAEWTAEPGGTWLGPSPTIPSNRSKIWLSPPSLLASVVAFGFVSRIVVGARAQSPDCRPCRHSR